MVAPCVIAGPAAAAEGARRVRGPGTAMEMSTVLPAESPESDREWLERPETIRWLADILRVPSEHVEALPIRPLTALVETPAWYRLEAGRLVRVLRLIEVRGREYYVICVPGLPYLMHVARHKVDHTPFPG